MGCTSANSNHRPTSARCTLTLTDLHKQVQRFWEQEQVCSTPILSPDDQFCEELFDATHTRDSSGRYSVRLPIREEARVKLGESRLSASHQLLSLERRLARKPELREKYVQFLNDYSAQGHMEPAPATSIASPIYYLPHHSVVKQSDPSGKIRVVFNASAKTSTGYSLNDCLLTGPKLQQELWIVLTRWRLFPFVFTADIVQMFKIQSCDQDLQRILWRADPAMPVQSYCLTTVTYGTSPAPYLANRTLRQLAHDEKKRFPLGSTLLKHHAYVDDMLAGEQTLDQAMQVKAQLINILNSSGFQLSKWAANVPQLSPVEGSSDRLFSDPEGIATLGLLWSASSDFFKLRAVSTCSTQRCTKRTILSDVARFFDPLGCAAPVLISGKVFLQLLWKLKLQWDDPLPPQLHSKWLLFAVTLTALDRVSVPRYLNYSSHNSTCQLIGFCDASADASAASVYLRCTVGDVTSVNLLVAKTRVAPISTVSIPRLELCGAVLLAKLIQATAAALNFTKIPWFLWTDAKVVLCWLRAHPSKWKPYVANRVSLIHEITETSCWHYVNTQDNPADLGTRGITPNDLIESDLWWHGPPWLSRPLSEWPLSETPLEEGAAVQEANSKTLICHSKKRDHGEDNFIARFSSFSQLLRTIALCLRYVHNSRSQNSQDIRVGFVTTRELAKARTAVIYMAQKQDFEDELKALRNGRPISSTSKILALHPFLSDDGLMRVGGRLQHANLPSECRNPPILAKDNHLSLLLARHAHAQSQHGGPQVMRAILLNYWITHIGTLTRRVAQDCIKCARYQSTTPNQLMGQLPADRVRPSRPFSVAGVDFAGPFNLVAYRGRGHTTRKGYLSLFICLASKAVHLELVSDLTTSAFIAAFKRFVARRGHCQRLYSDNATNFRGADKELQAMLREAALDTSQTAAALAALGTEWKFIPPAAPHFGGIWEAGIKSAKRHLRRAVGEQVLSYEELLTLSAQIEACLNSRPLYPMSANPQDLISLTPGHLLLGEPPVNIPERQYRDRLEQHTLTRYQHISRMRDEFWYRWSKEYLNHLQPRRRWHRETENIPVGTLVVVKNELQPPARWLLGRVIQVHPGSDNAVRVVSLQTANGVLKRPITKICILPIPVDGD